MLTLTKYAAIDIGSNAMRLLIMHARNSKNTTNYKKVSLVRVPIRLGQEAFTNGRISAATSERFVEAMQAYRHLMNVHEVKAYRACATSAMREAENGNELVALVKEKADVNIEIISGQEEAAVIYATHIENVIGTSGNYLYVDVGGGSTETTVFSNGKLVKSKSFNIGTIRLLNQQVDNTHWDNMKVWLQEATSGYENLQIIGSGGNITKIYKILQKNNWQTMSKMEMEALYKTIETMSVDERIVKYTLNPDRADVLEHAFHIYMNIMHWCNISEVHVPKMGLADGLIKQMHEG